MYTTAFHEKVQQFLQTLFHKWNPNVIKTMSHDINAGGKYYYGVRVVTGQQDGSGTTDTGVFVNLIGSKGQSGKIYLMNWLTALSGTAKTRTYDDLLVESDGDLGDILVVVLGNDKNWIAVLGAPWFVDFVYVHDFQSKSHQEFPCYHWIGDGSCVTFTAKTGRWIIPMYRHGRGSRSPEASVKKPYLYRAKGVTMQLVYIGYKL